jgi:hypothetical protein
VAKPPAFYLDENVDIQVAVRLRAGGFDVITTRDAGRLTLPDESHLEYAADNGFVMVTRNVDDFTMLSRSWASSGRQHAGLVLTAIEDPRAMAQSLMDLAALYPNAEDWVNVTLWAVQ